MLEALLWDVDGTLAETERDGHLVAFNEAFAALGLPWRWSLERYGELLRIAGGRERLLYDMQAQPDAPSETASRAALAAKLHGLKNEAYARIVESGALPLRAGVAELIRDCHERRLPMAIVTTTSGANIQALLSAHLGIEWRAYFQSVIGAEEAPAKKPDRQAYDLALAQLRLPPASALAIEDAPAGLAAARAAGVPVVLQHSFYFPHPEAQGALASGPSLGSGRGWQAPRPADPARRIDLDLLSRWHAMA